MAEDNPVNQLNPLAKAERALQEEIAKRKVAEEETRLLVEITQAVGEARDFQSALEVALRKVCEFTGWELGLARLLSDDSKTLVVQASWHRESHNLTEFVNSCRGYSFALGEGISGRVWASRQPLWIPNLAAQSANLYPLARLAIKVGFNAIAAVPVFENDEIIAVLVFSTFAVREKDNRQIAIIAAVAAQLGFAFQGKRAEEALRKNAALLRQAGEELEIRVQERTLEFLRANEGLAIEIAERKKAEGALHDREEELRLALQFNQAVMANMGEGLYVLDTLGLVTYINPAAERLFGWSSAELLGRKMHDVTHYRHTDGTPFPAEDCPGLEVLQKGVALADQEDVFIRKDGTFFPVVYSSSPIRLKGTVMGLVVVFRDVAAQKQAEEALQHNASWLRGLIATTQDAVLSIDRRGCIVLFNPAAERIFGYGAEEIVGRKVNELMAEPYASEHDEYIARYERTGEARAIGRIRTVTAKRKNGELFPIEVSVTEIEVDQEIRYAAFIRDISEKAKLQGQLVESERLAAIGTTAAKIGHELANPLNGMSLTIQLLEQRLRQPPNPPDSQVTATVKRLKDEISRLTQLVGQFRLISRKERYDFQPTALAGLIDDVVKIQRPHFAQLNIQIDQLVPPDLPTIIVDKDKIKQALLNLLKNAAEAMPGGGKISIKAGPTEYGVLVEITDTGMGVPLDVDAFEPFVTTKKEGTGIGLVVVRQIVTAHGGNVSYRSRPGEGATFRIELARQTR